MDTVNDYVNLEETPKETPKRTKPKPKPRKKHEDHKGRGEEYDEGVNTEVEEMKRKRDVLASVAMLDGLEKYVEGDVSVIDVRKMSASEVEVIFKLYQEKSRQELVKDGMEAVVSVAVKGLSYFFTFDDEDSLKKDLMENKPLRTFGRSAPKATEEYGDVVAVLKVAWDIAKHVVISPPPKGEADKGGKGGEDYKQKHS